MGLLTLWTLVTRLGRRLTSEIVWSSAFLTTRHHVFVIFSLNARDLTNLTKSDVLKVKGSCYKYEILVRGTIPKLFIEVSR